MTSFADLRLSDAVLSALRDVGYESPSPIQEQAIPELLAGRDVIGQAQTGTGKTAAFGLPMIEFVDPDDRDTQALVLTPTRELCIQVTQALRTYGRYKGLDPVAIFGGAPIRTQQAQLKQGAQIVVGTVGRVLDLISRHSLSLLSCRYLVLDEADEMLDLGFLEDVERILGMTPNGRQTALFSATMPAEIRALAERHLYDPVTVKVKAATLTIDTVEQFFVETKAADKTETLARVLEAERPDQAIVFVRTKIRCEQLYRTLRDRGMNVKALHGDMSQGARDGVMISFKGGRVQILVATDVAARGLDISTVTHIVNFDIPTSPDVYVHRIGRTGRVGRSGRAITFVEPRQARELAAIERHANTRISPWAEGAHVGPAKVQERRPRRHRKPHDAAAAVNGDGGFRKLIASGGRAAGLAESDLIAAVARTGLDGEAIRNVRLLEQFMLFEVPADQAARVADSVDGTDVRGHTLRLELAKG
jgi:ATP-dependent RNA helicase DeaD